MCGCVLMRYMDPFNLPHPYPHHKPQPHPHIWDQSYAFPLCHFALAIETCLKTCLPRVNLPQIILLRGYIHPNEQPVVFIQYMLCRFAAHWWFCIYCACAETSIGTFITPEKCKRYTDSSRATRGVVAMRPSCFAGHHAWSAARLWQPTAAPSQWSARGGRRWL